jgi:hypothetical protein
MKLGHKSRSLVINTRAERAGNGQGFVSLRVIGALVDSSPPGSRWRWVIGSTSFLVLFGRRSRAGGGYLDQVQVQQRTAARNPQEHFVLRRPMGWAQWAARACSFSNRLKQPTLNSSSAPSPRSPQGPNLLPAYMSVEPTDGIALSTHTWLWVR